ncbi:peptide chain release factor RF2 [Neisseria mucosa]|uniref:peptide chain release factor RF2 n=1 Tax=Neisseria mucosa TaxID=488 RepID=UPI000196D784|nr:peptide chain release factor RF2 [Neisseria mucosa]
MALTQQNSQAKAHTDSAKPKKQRSSETQNIENDKKDGNSDTESPRRLLGKDSVA